MYVNRWPVITWTEQTSVFHVSTYITSTVYEGAESVVERKGEKVGAGGLIMRIKEQREILVAGAHNH